MQQNKSFLRIIIVIFLLTVAITSTLQHINLKRNLNSWLDENLQHSVLALTSIEEDFDAFSSKTINVINADEEVSKLVEKANILHKVSVESINSIQSILDSDLNTYLASENNQYSYINSYQESEYLIKLFAKKADSNLLENAKAYNRAETSLNSIRQQIFKLILPVYQISYPNNIDQIRVFLYDMTVLVSISDESGFNPLVNRFGYQSDIPELNKLTCDKGLNIKANDHDYLALRNIVPFHENNTIIGAIECSLGLISVNELLHKRSRSSSNILWLKDDSFGHSNNMAFLEKTKFKDGFSLCQASSEHDGKLSLVSSALERNYYGEIRDKFYDYNSFVIMLKIDNESNFATFLPITDSVNEHYGYFISLINSDYFRTISHKKYTSILLTSVFIAAILMILYFIQCKRNEKSRVNQALGTVTEKLLEGLFVVNRNGKVRFVNKAGTLFLGMQKDNIIDSNVSELLRKIEFADSVNWETIINDIDKNGYYTNDEGIIELEQVTIAASIMAIYIAPHEEIIHDFQDSIVLMLNDITHHKLYERQLLYAKQDAETSDRLKSTFLNNFSHEIRTPLNSIVGFSYLLKNEETPQETVDRYVDIIHTNSEYLLKVVQNIIEISQLEQDEYKLYPAEFSLNGMMHDLFRDFERNINDSRKPIKLICKTGLDNNEDMVYSDSKRLKAVLEHLLDNAVKFTELGEIEFGYKQQYEGTLMFWVRDTGIGIDSSEQCRVFKPFYQIKDGNHIKFSGTGLGLSIASRVVQLMGGNLWLESEYTQGSTLQFEIPLITKKDIEDELNLLGIES